MASSLVLLPTRNEVLNLGEIVPRLLAALEERDVAIGSRHVAGGGVEAWPIGRRALSRAGSLYARTLLRLPARDVTSGFRAYRAEALAAIDLERVAARGFLFQIEMLALLAASGARIGEVPILFHNRARGASKLSAAIVAEAATGVIRLALRRRRGEAPPRRIASAPPRTVSVIIACRPGDPEPAALRSLERWRRPGTLEFLVTRGNDWKWSSAGKRSSPAQGPLPLSVFVNRCTRRCRRRYWEGPVMRRMRFPVGLFILTLFPTAVGAQPRFGPPLRVDVGASPIQVLADDVNNDGKVDLVAACVSGTPGSYTYTVETRFGDDKGSFDVGSSSTSVGELGYGAFTVQDSGGTLRLGVGRPIALADVDNANGLDLIAIDQSTTPKSIRWYVNNGSGSFTGDPSFKVDCEVTCTPTSVVAGDFDGGTTDIVAGETASDSTLIVFYKGGGGLTAGQTFKVEEPDGDRNGHFISDMIVGHWWEASHLDVAVSIVAAAGEEAPMFAMFPGNGDGTFDASQTHTGFGAGYTATAIVAGNGFFTEFFVSLPSGVQRFRRLLGWVDGGLTSTPLPYDTVVGDWDGEGYDDMTTGAADLSVAGGLRYWDWDNSEGTWSGSSPEHVRSDGDGPRSLITADLNSLDDTNDDLAVTSFRQKAVSVLLNFQGKTTWVDRTLTDMGPVEKGERVFLLGGGLDSVASVAVGGKSALQFTPISPTLLSFKLPGFSSVDFLNGRGRMKLVLKDGAGDPLYTDPLGLSVYSEHSAPFAFRLHGDADGNGAIDAGDGTRILNFAFSSTGQPPRIPYVEIDLAQERLGEADPDTPVE